VSRTSKITLAFVTVCLAWGASYFAIRIGLRALPPLTMGAVRYLIAGGLLWIWCNYRGEELLTRRQWLVAGLLGLCFVVVGNGTVLWAERSVPSGATALLVAVTPIGTLLFEWALRMRPRPTLTTWVGLALGLSGVVLISVGSGQGATPLLPVMVLLLGTLGWSLGSVLSLKLERPLSPIRAIASQMLAGGVILFALSGCSGEPLQIRWSAIDLSSLLALGYLILFASIAAYIAYGYLMTAVSPTAAGACSYVNPVVAMVLGAAFGERMGGREIGALVAVLAGVALVSSQELMRSRSPIKALATLSRQTHALGVVRAKR
jgi:drug/metabolite transporter (DMT)-like permease